MPVHHALREQQVHQSIMYSVVVPDPKNIFLYDVSLHAHDLKAHGNALRATNGAAHGGSGSSARNHLHGLASHSSELGGTADRASGSSAKHAVGQRGKGGGSAQSVHRDGKLAQRAHGHVKRNLIIASSGHGKRVKASIVRGRVGDRGSHTAHGTDRSRKGQTVQRRHGGGIVGATHAVPLAASATHNVDIRAGTLDLPQRSGSHKLKRATRQHGHRAEAVNGVGISAGSSHGHSHSAGVADLEGRANDHAGIGRLQRRQGQSGRRATGVVDKTAVTLQGGSSSVAAHGKVHRGRQTVGHRNGIIPWMQKIIIAEKTITSNSQTFIFELCHRIIYNSDLPGESSEYGQNN